MGISVSSWFAEGSQAIKLKIQESGGLLWGCCKHPSGSRGRSPWKLLTSCHFWGLKMAKDPEVSLAAYVNSPQTPLYK